MFVFVRHTFSLHLTVFWPPLPEVQCPKFLDLQNPWGKVMERSVKGDLSKVFLPPLPEIQYPNFLDFQNPWGKVMERSVKGVK